MRNIVIVDYGAGNLRSVSRAIAHQGFEPTISCEARAIDAADVLILPGVGAAADTMRNLNASGMVDPIRDYIASGKPFFGVCMGQQALLSLSEEGGEHPCLNIIPGRVKKLAPGQKIPHMGWNTVRQTRPHRIFEGIPDESYFYFVHSYAPHPDESAVVIGETGVLNNTLRFDDEFVRHKALDAVGDLSLLGYPVLGRLEAVKAGHSLHAAVAQKLLANPDAFALVPSPLLGGLELPLAPAPLKPARA